MGLFNLKTPTAMIVSVILLVVGLQVLVQVLPDLITAIINISQVGNLSFSAFFASGGVVLLMLSVGILMAIFGIFGIGRGKR